MSMYKNMVRKGKKATSRVTATLMCLQVEKSVLRVNAGMPDLTLSEGRYKGKKATRKSLSGKPDDEDEECDKGLSIDEKEHAEAELGYLLEGGPEDDDEESDQEEEGEEEQGVSEEESIEENVERDEEDDWEDVENTVCMTSGQGLKITSFYSD